jgi:hypothetical protein
MSPVKGLRAVEPGAAGAPLVAVMLACALLAPGCRPRESYEITLARATAESRKTQIANLERMIAQAERGELVTSDQIAIGISEELVKSLLKVSLPPTIVVAERVSIKFESAQTFFRGGQAGIIFRARGTSVDVPDASATLELGGGLEDFKFEGGKLAARVKLNHFTILESSIGDLAASVFDGLVRGHLDVLENAIPSIEIPVHLEQSIKIGGLNEGAVVAKPGILPLSISVSQVIPTNQRLWVLLEAKAGPWQVASADKSANPKPATPKPATPKPTTPGPEASKPEAPKKK